MTVTALRTTALALLAVLATLGVFGTRNAAAQSGVTDLAITAVCRFTPLVPDAEFPENLNTVLAITVTNVGSVTSTQPVIAWFKTDFTGQKGPAQEIPNTNGLAPGAQKRFKLPTLWYSGLSPVKQMVVGIDGGGGIDDPVANQRVYFANPYAIPAC